MILQKLHQSIQKILVYLTQVPNPSHATTTNESKWWSTQKTTWNWLLPQRSNWKQLYHKLKENLYYDLQCHKNLFIFTWINIGYPWNTADKNSYLIWGAQIEQMTKKTPKKLWLLRRMKQLGVDARTVTNYWKSKGRCYLEFCAPVWSGGITKALARGLTRVQQHTVAAITGSWW